MSVEEGFHGKVGGFELSEKLSFFIDRLLDMFQLGKQNASRFIAGFGGVTTTSELLFKLNDDYVTEFFYFKGEAINLLFKAGVYLFKLIDLIEVILDRLSVLPQRGLKAFQLRFNGTNSSFDRVNVFASLSDIRLITVDLGFNSFAPIFRTLLLA